jgi:hypothetical protein
VRVRRRASRCEIADEVFVRETHDAEAFALEETIARRVIAFAFRVKRTIEFDNQFALRADEVCDVRTDRNLPSEFEAAELSFDQKSFSMETGSWRISLARASSGPRAMRVSLVASFTI